MRSTPLVGRKLWFAPRRFGWGWAPISWEGWVVSASALVALFACDSANGLWRPLGALLVLAFLSAVCVAKGTVAGGPSLRAKFDRARKQRPLVRGGGDNPSMPG